MNVVLIFSLFFGWSAKAASNEAEAKISIECNGKNAKKEDVSFRILQDAPGALSGSLYSKIKRPSGITVGPIRRLQWTSVTGCVGSDLSGFSGSKLTPVLTGNLYFECVHRGAYTWAELTKTGKKNYRGFIYSQKGVSTLDIAAEETVQVRCKAD